jgi:DNA-binding NarL/FixJ family response regulator
MQKTITLAIAEDHQIFREQLAIFLNGNPNIEVKFTSANGQLLLEQLEKKLVDVVLLDLDMPIMDGRKALTRIRKKYGETVRIIIFSMHDAAIYAKKYIKAGANAYLDKTCDALKLFEVIETVYLTGSYTNEATCDALFQEIRDCKKYDHSVLEGERLTERELEVCQLICKGFTCPEIAEKLTRSVRTIENHKSRIFQKFCIGSCTQMMEKAIKLGYYEIEF